MPCRREWRTPNSRKRRRERGEEKYCKRVEISAGGERERERASGREKERERERERDREREFLLITTNSINDQLLGAGFRHPSPNSRYIDPLHDECAVIIPGLGH